MCILPSFSSPLSPEIEFRFDIIQLNEWNCRWREIIEKFRLSCFRSRKKHIFFFLRFIHVVCLRIDWQSPHGLHTTPEQTNEKIIIKKNEINKSFFVSIPFASVSVAFQWHIFCCYYFVCELHVSRCPFSGVWFWIENENIDLGCQWQCHVMTRVYSDKICCVVIIVLWLLQLP